jgi:hypothetical protein
LKKLSVFTFVLVVLLTAVGCEQHHRKGAEITTPYAAVLLDNNQVYFGKLANADSEFPELTDVYYIQTQQNQETKEVKSVLVRRGNEVHAPDRMFVNERHVILIEPVGPNSKVAQLIADDKSKH